jgi:hypothetical protein
MWFIKVTSLRGPLLKHMQCRVSGYGGAVAWSEVRKAIGRAEVQRQLPFETASTYRKSFFNASRVVIAFLLIASLGKHSFRLSTG